MNPIKPIIIALVGISPLHAAISGSDDFNDNSKDSTKWTADVADGGTLTETNSRVEYTAPAGSSERFAFRPWNLNKASYDTDWEVTLDVRNTLAFNSGVQKEGSVGLLVYPTATPPTSDTPKALSLGLFSDWQDGFSTKGFIVYCDDSDEEAIADSTSTSGAVRIVFNSRTKILYTYYDADGATNGYTWTPLGTLGVGGAGGAFTENWGMSGAATFEVAVFGSSEGIAITSGQATADNFAARTIPARTTLTSTPVGDDFNDNSKSTANWEPDIGDSGILTETGGRLQYTIPTAGEDKSAYRPWNGPQPHYNMNWETTIDLFNNMSAAGTWDAGCGIAIVKGGDIDYQFWIGQDIYREAGAPIETEMIAGHHFAGEDMYLQDQILPTTAGLKSVRITFNAATKVFTGYFDADGPANGYQWTLLGTLGIAGSGGVVNVNWGMTGSEPFDIAPYGFSEEVAVSAGQIYLDNFSVSSFTENFQIHEWKAAKFGNPLLAAAALTADSDQDGLTNLSEYAFNLDTAKGELPVLVAGSGTAGLPRITTTGSGSTQKLRLEYVRRKASVSPGVNYVAQFSGDLTDAGAAPWTPASGAETVTSISPIWERVVVEDTAGAGQSKRFGRVRLVAP